MSNIFKERQLYAEGVKRSTFDLSHRNNFTTKIGQITPILCQECFPGDSFQIKANLGLRFAPLVYPIQTPLVASVQFFKVPHRILWDNFEDFIGDTKEGIVHPYISQPYMWHPTGSLADYLGVPSTYATSGATITHQFSLFGDHTVTREVIETEPSYSTTGTVTTEVTNAFEEEVFTGSIGANTYNLTTSVNSHQSTIETLAIPYALYDLYRSGTQIHTMQPNYPLNNFMPTSAGYTQAGVSVTGRAFVSEQIPALTSSVITLPSRTNDATPGAGYGEQLEVTVIYSDSVHDPNFFSVSEGWTTGKTYFYEQVAGDAFDVSSAQVPNDFVDYINDILAQHANVRLVLWSSNSSIISADGTANMGQTIGLTYVSDIVQDVDSSDSPFVVQPGEEFPAVRINALPFRAYQSIFNCYFRSNPTVDPFILNGEPEYNKWITNTGDGADSTTPLSLEMRNFELDYLTSAVNTPQQGEAPLVGVSSTGTFTFKDENDVEYTAQAVIDPDTGKLTGIDTYDPGLPASSLHRLMDTITHGISINDFRNVNAFQRWKEKNLRRGMRYKDQVLSHFGVDAKSVHYDDPSFIGGFTRDVQVNALTSQTSTTEINLGDYGGQASLFVDDRDTHSITTYCDEHCFIIGLLTIVPIPVYSQTLDPMFNKLNIFSYQWPEYNHLGYQAIPYKFVTPIESYVKGKGTGENELDKTFGYQRPYWEMVAKTDSAHSHMRTDMSNYLMTRYFATPPELGHDFLAIDPSSLTSPFVDTDAQADNIVGQIYFDISAQRPVSRMAIPRIEP